MFSSGGRRRDQDQQGDVMTHGQVSVARVPARESLFFAPARIDKVEELFSALASRFDPSRQKSESVYPAVTDMFRGAERDVNVLKHLVNYLADSACSLSFSELGLLSPTLSFVDSLRFDFTTSLEMLHHIAREMLESLIAETRQAWYDYVSALESEAQKHGEKGKRSEAAAEDRLRKCLKNLLHFSHSVVLTIVAILIRAFAVRTIDLPPSFRSTFVNVKILGSEVVYGRSLERLEPLQTGTQQRAQSSQQVS